MTLFTASGAILSSDVVRFGTLRFWSERGLIHIEDSRDNSYEAISVRVALQRMKAISDLLGNSTQRQKHSHSQFDNAFRQRNQDMLDGMCELVRKAQIQGMPSDPTASRDLVRRAKKTVVVPGFNSQM